MWRLVSLNLADLFDPSVCHNVELLFPPAVDSDWVVPPYPSTPWLPMAMCITESEVTLDSLDLAMQKLPRTRTVVFF